MGHDQRCHLGSWGLSRPEPPCRTEPEFWGSRSQGSFLYQTKSVIWSLRSSSWWWCCQARQHWLILCLVLELLAGSSTQECERCAQGQSPLSGQQMQSRKGRRVVPPSLSHLWGSLWTPRDRRGPTIDKLCPQVINPSVKPWKLYRLLLQVLFIRHTSAYRILSSPLGLFLSVRFLQESGQWYSADTQTESQMLSFLFICVNYFVLSDWRYNLKLWPTLNHISFARDIWHNVSFD